MSLLDLLIARTQQGTSTVEFPPGEAPLATRFRGRPSLDATRCPSDCHACADACPTAAIELPLRLDLGRCILCPECESACPEGAIRLTPDYRLAARRREDLHLTGEPARLAHALEASMRRLFGRSLKLRQVCAGGCSGCEAELTALGNVVFDLGRFGVQFVASPRHADGLVLTGPVTDNMRHALLEAYRALPSPRIVIALGTCAISGGVFAARDGSPSAAPPEIPIDLYVPGCPPHPFTVLDGLLRLLGRLER